MLAQLDEGVVDTVIRSGSHRVSWTAELGAWIAKGARTSDSEEGVQESKSMQDLIFTLFEDIADSTGLIRAVESNAISRREDWEASSVHSRFEEGELVRVFTPVMIIDPEFLSIRFKRFLEMSQRLNAVNAHNASQALAQLRETFDQETDNLVADGRFDGSRSDDRKRREQIFWKERGRAFQSRAAEIEAQYGQVESTGLSEFFDFMETYMSLDSIYVRFLACGPEHPEYAFTGSLLSRDEYIQRERETLYARYGARLEGWTSVLQIARVPTAAEGESAREASFADLVLTGASGIKRATILERAAALETMLEAQGIAEGPVWPSISVVPLAIYRVVPRSIDLSVDDSR
jgi:hypothetical protein